MDTFDGSKPDLISNKTIKDIEAKLDTSDDEEGNRVLNGLGFFYSEYIAPNMFPIIVILLLIIYLTIKYILKKDREEREEEEEEKEEKQEITKEHILKKEPKTVVKKKKPKRNVSDMISDDYLITNDTENDQDNDGPSRIDPNSLDDLDHLNDHNMSQIDNREQLYNIDKAAKVVFGQE